MKHNEFVIGQDFICADRRWRCTDIGCRVIVAIPADYAEITRYSAKQMQTKTTALTEKDLFGPTYWLAEIVFDEDGMISCELITLAE